MNYVVKMGSGAMVYIRSLIKIVSGIQKLFEGKVIYIETPRQQGDLISLLLFFKTRKVW
jgi:hypothetical protein